MGPSVVLVKLCSIYYLASTTCLHGRRAGWVAHLATRVHVAVIAPLIEVIRMERLIPVQAVHYWMLRVEVAVRPAGRGEEPSDDVRPVGCSQGRRHVSVPLCVCVGRGVSVNSYHNMHRHRHWHHLHTRALVCTNLSHVGALLGQHGGQ